MWEGELVLAAYLGEQPSGLSTTPTLEHIHSQLQYCRCLHPAPSAMRRLHTSTSQCASHTMLTCTVWLHLQPRSHTTGTSVPDA